MKKFLEKFFSKFRKIIMSGKIMMNFFLEKNRMKKFLEKNFQNSESPHIPKKYE
jgi:hypothetical protein